LFAPSAAISSDPTKPTLGIDNIALTSGLTLNAGIWQTAGSGSSAPKFFVFLAGQIFLDDGAFLDVFGLQNVARSLAENIVTTPLPGGGLADSPLQRNCPLRRQSVQVDLNVMGEYNGVPWIGTPLANVSGYINLVGRTVGELSINGGTISLNAGGSAVVQPGATLNVSGGSIAYTGAMVQTTKVLSDGHIFDISQSTPDRVYDVIYNGFTVVHSKWGIVDTFASPLENGAYFEAGYIYGGLGGGLSITAPAMALDGQFLGNTVTGPRQTVTPPTPSSLSLAFQQEVMISTFVSPTPPDIIFGSEPLAPADPFALDSSGMPLPLRADRTAEVILSPDLINADGFGILEIDNGDGTISVPGNVTLSAPPRGSITMSAANMEIDGHIQAPGGNLSFVAYDFSPFGNFVEIPPPDPTRGHFVLGSGASLNTDGLLVDNRPGVPTGDRLPIVITGGSVSIRGFDIDTSAGSLIDVSGGAEITATG